MGIGEAMIKEANAAVSRVLAEKQPQQSSTVPADRKRKYNTLCLAQNRDCVDCDKDPFDSDSESDDNNWCYLTFM